MLHSIWNCLNIMFLLALTNEKICASMLRHIRSKYKRFDAQYPRKRVMPSNNISCGHVSLLADINKSMTLRLLPLLRRPQTNEMVVLKIIHSNHYRHLFLVSAKSMNRGCYCRFKLYT